MFVCFTLDLHLYCYFGRSCTPTVRGLFLFTLFVVSGEFMGQERGWAPLKAGFKPPVAFAIDRAKAVSHLYPGFLFV